MLNIQKLENIVKKYRENIINSNNFHLDLENFLGNILITISDILRAKRTMNKKLLEESLTQL